MEAMLPRVDTRGYLLTLRSQLLLVLRAWFFVVGSSLLVVGWDVSCGVLSVGHSRPTCDSMFLVRCSWFLVGIV